MEGSTLLYCGFVLVEKGMPFSREFPKNSAANNNKDYLEE